MSDRDFIVYTSAGVEEELRRAMEDYLLYGQSAVQTYTNGTTEPAIRRIDPADIVVGEGIRAQMENANTSYYESLDVDSIREALEGLINPEEAKKRRRMRQRVNIPGKTVLKRGRNER